MRIQNKIIYFGTLMLTLLLPVNPATAAEEKICAPFKNSNVDHTLIESMLKAAVDGKLYRVKTNSSKMGFCVDSSVGVVKGEFQSFKGGLALEGDNSQTLLAIDVGSLDTNISFIEGLLKGESFFNVKDYPELIFVSSGFEWVDDKRAVLKGMLSMRGVTKEVAFYIEVTQIDGEPGGTDSIMVKATTTVQRSEFGMVSLSTMVDDKVSLCMSIEAEKYRT